MKNKETRAFNSLCAIYHGRTFIRLVMCLWGYIMEINAWEMGIYFLSL